jgi:cytochrome P450/deferrochelatase/peroxidase EfeB
MDTKYDNSFARILSYPERSNITQRDFGLDRIPPTGWFGKLAARWTKAALRYLLLPLFRRIPPIIKFRGIHWVVRYDDVEAVLRDPDAFNVPFGLEMTLLAGGTNFALGDDGELHARQRAVMKQIWATIDLDSDVREPARQIAGWLLADAGGEIDAIKDLFTRVATETCLKLYGLTAENADEFAEFAMSTTALLFADPSGESEVRIQAMYGAERLRDIIDRNYDRLFGAPDNSILGRLIAIAKSEPEKIGGVEADSAARRGEIRALLFGLITGFVPTNTMSAGHILEELTFRPSVFGDAVRLSREAEAARRSAGPQSADYLAKRDALQALLFEAARFNPALFPGQFRVRTGRPLNSGGGGRLSGIPPGETVIAATASALMDAAKFPRPYDFDPGRFAGRPAPRNLMFGIGEHDCIGEELAKAIIVELFQVLLAQNNIRFASKSPRLMRAGPFPRHMLLRYDPDTGQRRQSMICCAVPLAANAPIDEVRALLRSFGHPKRPRATQADATRAASIDRAFRETGIVHFASINVIDLGTATEPRHHLLVELNVDGAEEAALSKIVQKVGDQVFQPLMKYVDAGQPPMPAEALLKRRRIKLHTWPWGAIGVNFPGTADFSVAQIADEDGLYDEVKSIVDSARTGRNIPNARAAIDGDGGRYVLREARRQLAGTRFAPLLVRPSARLPAFSKWTDFSFEEFVARAVTTPNLVALYAAFIVATVLVPLFGWWLFAATIPVTYVVFWMTPALGLVTLAIAFLYWLRHREAIERPEDLPPAHDHMRRLLATEDIPGYVQNHLTSVTELKSGPFRKLTMALSLQIIKQMVRIWFRPGFVTDFATIHYAKWFRVPGTQKLIFQSNYDGSWESYLEDFITKVHGGQTAAWNNGVGFPRTNWFYFDGARDGDRFKRWVRRQQVETLFWYSRFPHLTTEQIRANALVREGLARARTSAEAQAWEDLIHSPPRPRDTIQSEQVQSILFGGLGRLGQARGHLVKFGDPELARGWIRTIAETSYNAETISVRPDGPALALGDYSPDEDAVFIAFTAAGLRTLGFPEGNQLEGFGTLPLPFVDGMAKRSNILGDVGANAPDHWQWSDAPDDAKVCHAVVLHYGSVQSDAQRAAFEKQDEELLTMLAAAGMTAQTIKMSMSRKRGDHREPFGFVDSVSQPVMRGTRQFGKGDFAPDDVVAPGEFLLGYKDTRGYYPPSPTVSQTRDDYNDLPPLQDAIPDRFPEFNNSGLSELRDFGRNGSFLVIRQLEQDVDAFNGYVRLQAEKLVSNRYFSTSLRVRNPGIPDHLFAADHLHAEISGKIGTSADSHGSTDMNVTMNDLTDVGGLTVNPAQRSSSAYDVRLAEELIAAKLMGRWRDGSSLVRNPMMSRSQQNKYVFFAELRKRIMMERRILDDPDAEGRALTFDELVPSGDGLMSVIWDAQSDELIRQVIRNVRKALPSIEVPLELLAPVKPDNDFRHGTDDPQGLACPIVSHVRKSNPRDSFRPGSPLQLEINNRHRILRRGRTYQSANGEDAGTFFMCFNANIERQFEFIQQTWSNSRTFSGLRNCPDPIISAKTDHDRFILPTSDLVFSLPLDARPQQDSGHAKVHADFVKVVGGGYFFLPSLQALRFIARPVRTNHACDNFQ